MRVFKIFRDREWAAMQADGQTAGAPVDIADGFVHLSTAAQVEETARRHFAGEKSLFLVSVDIEALGDDLAWEPARSRGGDPFPHLYRALRMSDVARADALNLEGGRHIFPEDALAEAGLPEAPARSSRQAASEAGG